jgi:hypothetical protein
MSSRLLDQDIKVFQDSEGVKREVLISYEKFLEIAEFLDRHAYFYSPEVQDRLRKSEEDLAAGRYIEVEGAEVDRALKWLAGHE